MESIKEILKPLSNNKFQQNWKTLSNGKPSSSHLSANGSDMDCPLCAGMGFFVPDVPPTHPSFGRATRCTCQAIDDERVRQENLLNMSQLGGLKHCTFASFQPEGHGLRAADQYNLSTAFADCQEYAQNPRGWLLIKGGYGCGKTHLAAAIANEQILRGYSVLFVNTPDLLDHLRATYAPSSTISYDKRFEQIRDASLLILDDLGTENNTGWVQEKLYQIFNHRYNARLPTIITTNQDLEDIEPRIRSRMVDLGLVKIIAISAPDFRNAGANVDMYDLSTLNLHSDKTFNTFDLRKNELPASQADNLKRAVKQAWDFAQHPQGWLVFNSISFGNGKTHLAAAIANYVAENGMDVLFVMVPDLLDHLRDMYHPTNMLRLDRRFNEIKKASLLVLDDLGTESATAWAREKLYQLFYYRYNAKLPTVITTATSIEKLDPKLAAQMLDGRHCIFFQLEIPSYRRTVNKNKRSHHPRLRNI